MRQQLTGVPKMQKLRRNETRSRPAALRRAANRARNDSTPKKTYDYPIKPPELAPGVVPPGMVAPVMATDANPYSYAQQLYQGSGGGFPGFQYLAQLATRAEYRAFAATMSTELTRKWIEFTSKQDDDNDSSEKIKAIEAEFERLGVREVVQRACSDDCFFGRGHIFIDIRGADRSVPLILSPATVPQGSLNRITNVEAVWTTPNEYNALDPANPSFYRPVGWFMLGQHVHASRLMTIVTRPLPDILKPAFNFAGMSLSQLAEPYVDNWLRTRQAVADLIDNFSTTALKTSMDQVLQGDDDGAASDLFDRADLFTLTRSNRGLMLLDKEREDLVQTNVPLSGLHELQAQSQEHMCSVSRMPAIVLTGISPSGLNATSEGEIRVFYDWIGAQQEAFWRNPIATILDCVQLSLFGEIDRDIGFNFVPLYQMTPKELADIREIDARTSDTYVNMGALDPQEVRDRIAKDPNSGYQGLDTSVEVSQFEPDGDDVADLQQANDGFNEGDHPRAANGQFGSGGGGNESSSSQVDPKDTITSEIWDNEKGDVVKRVFNKGDYVEVGNISAGSKSGSKFGDIEGVSHAKREIKVGGQWHDVNNIKPATRPEAPQPKKTALSKVIKSNNRKTGAGLTDADKL